jgi:hypothetical protein
MAKRSPKYADWLEKEMLKKIRRVNFFFEYLMLTIKLRSQVTHVFLLSEATEEDAIKDLNGVDFSELDDVEGHTL